MSQIKFCLIFQTWSLHFETWGTRRKVWKEHQGVTCFLGLASYFIHPYLGGISLRSSLFRFLLAGESETARESRANAWGESKKRNVGRNVWAQQQAFPFLPCPSPLCHYFFSPLSTSPRATPACLKGNGKDCYAGYRGINFKTTHYHLS